MQLTLLPPDLQTLVEKRLATGAYRDVEDVLRCALEAQEAEESWTDEKRGAITAQIEKGYQQALRGDLLDSEKAWLDVDAQKDEWLARRTLR